MRHLKLFWALNGCLNLTLTWGNDGCWLRGKCVFGFLNNLRIVCLGGRGWRDFRVGKLATNSHMCNYSPHPSQCHACDVRPRSTVFLTSVCPSWQRCGDLQCFHNEAELKNERLFQAAGVVWRSKKPLSVIPSSKKKKERNWTPQCGCLGVTIVKCNSVSH